MGEILNNAKAILNERRQPPSEWIMVLPAVQWGLNTAPLRRFGMSPFHVMLGKEPRIAFTASVVEDSEGVQLEKLDEKQIWQHLRRIVDAQEAK